MSGVVKHSIQSIHNLQEELDKKYSKLEDTVGDLSYVDGSPIYDYKVPSANAVKQAIVLSIDDIELMINNKIQPIINQLQLIKETALQLSVKFNSIPVEENSVVFDTVKAIRDEQDQHSQVINNLLQSLGSI